MSWLDTFITNPDWQGTSGRAKLARKIPVDPKTLKRWEDLLVKKPRFTRLAHLLGVTEAELRAAHRDAMAAKEKTTPFSQKERAKVDVSAIAGVFTALKSERFEALLLETTQKTSYTQVADLLKMYIQEEDINSLQLELNRPLNDFVASSTTNEIEVLNRLKPIYRAVLLACGVPNASKKGKAKPAIGVDQAFPLIFSIDAASGRKLNGHRRLVLMNENQIDDSVDTTLCVHLTVYDTASPKEWAYRCVEKIGDFFPLDVECPAFSDPDWNQKFEVYCSKLNSVLAARNNDDLYVLARSDASVPPEVVTYLLNWLTHLHLFDCADAEEGDTACNLMRGEPGVLGAWMAKGETAIEGRIKWLEDQYSQLVVSDSDEPKGELVVEPEQPKNEEDFMGKAVDATGKFEKIVRNLSKALDHIVPRFGGKD